MDSYQQPGPPAGDPYDFILNPSQSPKKSLLKGTGNNFIRTIIFVVGGALLLMIITTIALNIFAPKQLSKEDLMGLAQSQTELIRVANQGASGGVSQSTRNLATTVQYTLLTHEKQTIELLAKQGVEANEKELSLKQNAATDKALTSAKSTSTFDEAFIDILDEELNDYATALKNLTALATRQDQKERFSEYFRQTQLLIGQVPEMQTE